MIDPDDVPEEWRVESDRHPKGWDWENSDEGWDDSDRHWQWVDEPASHAVQEAPPPWYRGPKLLLGLIGLAAATLVVATALLVGGRFSGEIPTSRQLDSRTATPSQKPRTTASSTAEAQPTSTTSKSTEPTDSTESTTASPSEPPTVDQAPEPLGPPPPSDAPAPSQPAPKPPDGPRINVTRTPMSFTPSVSARP